MNGNQRSRGKLAVGLGAMGFEHKIMEIDKGKKIYSKNPLEEAAVSVGTGEESPHKDWS